MSATGSHKLSVGDRIVRAGIVISIAHWLFKLAGLIQARAMTQYLPAGTYETVYNVAFETCVFSFFLMGEEVIGPAFLPVFMRELDTRSEKAGWHFANVVLTLHFLILVAVVGAMVAFPGLFVQLWTAWDTTRSPERYAVATRALRWLAPSLICLSLGSTTYMLLNGYKRFFLAALGDASWKFCVFACVLIGMGAMGLGHEAVILGLLIGSGAKLGTHLLGLVRELHFFRPRLNLKNPALRAMLVLMLPLIAGILVAKVRDNFNNVTVLSHLQTQGLMQANSLGRKLYQPIGWLVPYALSIAMFPFFCELVDRNDHRQLGRILTQSGRMLLSIFIPLGLVCAVLAKPITGLLFLGGEFGPQNVTWTAVSMACYTLVLPAMGIEYLLMQAFFANRRMVSVTVAGIVFSFFSMGISYLAVVRYGLTGSAALALIAGGFALSRTLKSTALVLLLRRRTPCFPAVSTLVFIARALVVGILSAGPAALARWVFMTHVTPATTRTACIGQLAAAGTAAGIGFLAGVWLLRLEEPRTMLTWLLRKIHDRKTG